METNDQEKIPIQFIGAGPGAPDLITLRGRDLLRSADMVVYAGSLVPRTVTQHAPDDCEKLSSASLTLEEILEEIVEAYHQGKTVVRMHSGDPSIYGAIQEQMGKLDEQDIPYEVVPGVSSFTAMAAAIKSQLTLPEDVQSIILTRAGGRAETPDTENLEKMAATESTLCIFLSAKHARRVQDKLLEEFDPSTPAAIGYKVTRPEEEIVITKLKDLAADVDERGYKRTALFIVGEAIRARSEKQSGVYDPDHKHVYRPE